MNPDKIRIHVNVPLKQEVLLALWELLEDEIVQYSDDEDEPSQYSVPSSSDWIKSVGRGGLVHVTEQAYVVFSAIKEVVRTHLRDKNIKRLPMEKSMSPLRKFKPVRCPIPLVYSCSWHVRGNLRTVIYLGWLLRCGVRFEAFPLPSATWNSISNVKRRSSNIPKGYKKNCLP